MTTTPPEEPQAKKFKFSDRFPGPRVSSSSWSASPCSLSPPGRTPNTRRPQSDPAGYLPRDPGLLVERARRGRCARTRRSPCASSSSELDAERPVRDRKPDTGHAPPPKGSCTAPCMIFLFVLVFITVTMKTEAIQTYRAPRLAIRLSGAVLIAILMTVFAIGGTSYRMRAGRASGSCPVVPLTLALGYAAGRGRDHLPRGALDRLHRQPLRDRRCLRRGRDHDRRWHRPPHRDVGGARPDLDPVRDPVCETDPLEKSVVGISATDAEEARSTPRRPDADWPPEAHPRPLRRGPS